MWDPKRLFERLSPSVALPAIVLGMALLGLFVFQDDVRGFRSGHHGYLSAHGMALARNLSGANRFLMYNRAWLEPDGRVAYEPYNRFPIGAFAVLKLCLLPCGRNLGLEIAVGRWLMLAFFAATIVLAWLCIRRLVGCPWAATAASLLAMSSYYCLYYDDMLFNDVPTLFGMALVFHGMVVFVQDGRSRQLMWKSAVGVLLGWQVYALLMPFVLLGALEAGVNARSAMVALRSRYVVAGGFALGCGLVLLAANLANEQAALGSPWAQLPTFRKMLWRLGLAPAVSYREFGAFLDWREFGMTQWLRLGVMAMPQWLTPAQIPTSLPMAVGALALLVALVAAAVCQHRLLVLSVVISGAAWALPMRHFVAFHDFQSIFYVGIPLVAYAGLAILLGGRSRAARVALACVAMFGFLASIGQTNVRKRHAATAHSNALTADFQRIDAIVPLGHTVFVAADSTVLGGGGHMADFYLAGRYLQPRAQGAEFVVSQFRDPGAALLTPGNARVFLYRGANPTAGATGGPDVNAPRMSGVSR